MGQAGRQGRAPKRAGRQGRAPKRAALLEAAEVRRSALISGGGTKQGRVVYHYRSAGPRQCSLIWEQADLFEQVVVEALHPNAGASEANRAVSGGGVGIECPRVLKPQIDHSIGFQAPISTRPA